MLFKKIPNGEVYYVIHPLDDPNREQKVNIDDLGPINMTLSIKLILLVVRVYVILMLSLVVFSVVQYCGK